MLFYLNILNILVRFLSETALKLNEGEGNIQAISELDVWKHSDSLRRNYVINGLADHYTMCIVRWKLSMNCGGLWIENIKLWM